MHLWDFVPYPRPHSKEAILVEETAEEILGKSKNDVISAATYTAHVMFEKNKWTWYGDNDIPTTEEIEQTIRYLVDTLFDPQFDREHVSTGRLTVERSPYVEDDSSFTVLLQIGDYIAEEK